MRKLPEHWEVDESDPKKYNFKGYRHLQGDERWHLGPYLDTCPEGYRPLLMGEIPQRGDLFKCTTGEVWYPCRDFTPSDGHSRPRITKRPLPDLKPDSAAEIAKLRADLDSFDAIDKERNDALKTCMNLLETMHFNRRIFKVDAYTKEIEAAMAQIKSCYDPHA